MPSKSGKRQLVHAPPVVRGQRSRDWVAGDGHQRHVARVDERRRQDRQPRFRTDAVVDLGRRVERHAVLALHEPRDRLLELRRTVVGVAAVFRLADFLGHPVQHDRVGHAVVFADAEVQQPPLGVLGQRLALGPLDLLELVDRGPLAVLGSADAVGEQRLKIRIGHGCQQCMREGENQRARQGTPSVSRPKGATGRRVPEAAGSSGAGRHGRRAKRRGLANSRRKQACSRRPPSVRVPPRRALLNIPLVPTVRLLGRAIQPAVIRSWFGFALCLLAALGCPS